MPSEVHPYPFTGRQLPCLVGGEFVRQGRTFENINPVNGAAVCTVTEADDALVERAVQAARAALRGPWARLSMPERCALLRKVAQCIEQRFAEFVSAEIADTGEALVRHPDVNAIAFTGESATGAAIMRSAADSVKALSFELGGKNAAVVFADADFETAVSGTMRSVFSNCGQVCLCSERVYVERAIFERFVEALSARARTLKIGGPYEGADLGPLISRAHREKVLSYYRLAREEHGEIVCGGGVPAFGDERDRGAFIEPTIVRGLAEGSRCVKEEIFGPVCHVAPFDSEEQAVQLANDTRYGLAAAVRTSNLQRAHRVARQLAVGITWVNDRYLRYLRTPFGGVKLSGIGREGGAHSLAFFSEPMNICVKL